MSLGKITMVDGEFVVMCAPHVAVMIQRVFKGGTRTRAGVFAVKATPGAARTLEWFRQMYPLEVDRTIELDYRNLIDREERRLASVAEVERPGYEPREFELALPPRDYQRVAADLALRTRGLLIADELGLGKTITAICAIADKNSLPALVVTMTYLPRQWQRQIARFAPKLRSHRVRSRAAYDLAASRYEIDARGHRRRVKGQVPDVIIMNYHKVEGWVEELAHRIGVKSVVFDECQELRHTGTKKYDAAKAIADVCGLRIGLSVGAATRIELSGGPFGDGWAGAIEEAWRLVELVAAVEREGDYEVVRPEGVMGRGWVDAATGFVWKPVVSFIRHRATKPMVRVAAGGTRTEMTVDHSVFVVDHDGLSERAGAELSRGDVIPVDDGAWWETGPEKPIDVVEVAAEIDRAQVVVDLRGVNRRDLNLTAWQWQNCHKEATYGPRVPMRVYLANRWLKITGPVYIGRGRAASMPHEVKLSAWAYVLGFFLGDGWIEGSRVCFAVDQPRVREFARRLRAMGLGLRPKVHKRSGESSEVRVSHVILARLLERIVGDRCHRKRIAPEWVFTWDRESRRELLAGLVDSDGNRGKAKVEARSYTTTSLGLAEDVRLLVRSLGAPSTLHRREPTDGGVVRGRRIRGRHPSWQVVWSDAATTTRDGGRRGARHRFDRWRRVMREAPVRRVDAIEPDPHAYVYDLEMSVHPSFVANGLLCHNSATPIYNYGDEIWPILDVIAPDTLGGLDEFLREWCTGEGRKHKVKDPVALGSYLRTTGAMIRRTRADVGRELPALTVVRLTVEVDHGRISEASRTVAELAERVLSRTGTNFERMQAAGEMDWRMRQATGLGKAAAVVDHVRLLVESGERVLLFGWHREVYSLWTDAFEQHGVTYAMYTGEESEPQRVESVRRFVAGEAMVLVMSLRSGAGLDGLQEVCTKVVIAELDWSPKIHEQGIGRVHRDGQALPCTAYFLVADEGSDPVIADILGIKDAQSTGIVDPDRAGDPVLLGAEDDHMQRLARDILARAGRPIPQNDEEDDEEEAPVQSELAL